MTGRRSFDHHDRRVVVPHVHDELHRGHVFEASRDTGAVADTNTVDIQVTTGSRKAHATFVVNTTGAFLVDLYQGTTYTSDGTAVDSVNKNFNSANSASTTVRHSPTVNSTGTKKAANLIPGGTGGGASGKAGGSSGLERDNEWDLKPNTEYLLRLTNISGGSARAVVNVVWYEPELDE